MCSFHTTASQNKKYKRIEGNNTNKYNKTAKQKKPVQRCFMGGVDEFLKPVKCENFTMQVLDKHNVIICWCGR